MNLNPKLTLREQLKADAEEKHLDTHLPNGCDCDKPEPASGLAFELLTEYIDVSLTQTKDGLFNVRNGSKVSMGLKYQLAGTVLGHAIMEALVYQGRIKLVP